MAGSVGGAWEAGAQGKVSVVVRAHLTCYGEWRGRAGVSLTSMALGTTEWALICILMTIWAWLYHGRYHVGLFQTRTKARRAPMPESNSIYARRTRLLRFVGIPTAIIFSIVAVKDWLDVFAGVKSPVAPPDTLWVSGIFLLCVLGMTGYEIYLLRSGRRMVRPRSTASRATSNPRRLPTARRDSH